MTLKLVRRQTGTGHHFIMPPSMEVGGITMLLSLLRNTGAVVPETISSYCCSIPFTLNGNMHYSCTDNGAGFGCFYGDREWKQCRQPAGEYSQQIAVN